MTYCANCNSICCKKIRITLKSGFKTVNGIDVPVGYCK